MNLILHKYIVSFVVKETTTIPFYMGSMFRGAFGNALQRIDTTLYQHYFEPSISPKSKAYPIVQKYPPAPFILLGLSKGGHIKAGNKLQFELTLMGETVPTDAVLYQIFETMSDSKYGLEQCKTQFVGFEKILNPLTHTPGFHIKDLSRIETQNTSVTLQFMTPLGLKFNNDLITDFSFDKIQSYLYRRLFVLNHLYGDKKSKENNPFEAALQLDFVQMQHKNTYRKPADKDTYPMKGWLGQISYSGISEQVNKVYPLLKIGEWIHLGSDTSFGLGKYRIE